MAAIILLAFVLGLVLGSFVTAVAHRVPRNLPLVAARSACPACGEQIAGYDNIPVLSWLLLRGRARCCGARISPRYPLTEVVLGLLFALTVTVQWGDSVAEVAIDLVFLTVLAAVTLTDLEQRIIPNKILLVGAILCLAIAAPTDPAGLSERAIAAAAAGGLFFLVALPTRGGWAWATSSWPRRWASSSAAPSRRRSSSPCWSAASSAWR